MDIDDIRKEYDKLEVVTLDDFIQYLQRLSDVGYGDKQVIDEITGGSAYPYYDKREDKFLL
jgi:pantothenate kinase